MNIMLWFGINILLWFSMNIFLWFAVDAIIVKNGIMEIASESPSLMQGQSSVTTAMHVEVNVRIFPLVRCLVIESLSLYADLSISAPAPSLLGVFFPLMRKVKSKIKNTVHTITHIWNVVLAPMFL